MLVKQLSEYVRLASVLRYSFSPVGWVPSSVQSSDCTHLSFHQQTSSRYSLDLMHAASQVAWRLAPTLYCTHTEKVACRGCVRAVFFLEIWTWRRKMEESLVLEGNLMD